MLSWQSPDAYPFAARAHEGLDELVMGVLVPAAHQLGGRWAAIGSIVVPAGKIKWPDGIVRRTNREDPAHTRGAEPGGVADGGGFARFEILSHARAPVEAAGHQAVRAGKLRRCGDHD